MYIWVCFAAVWKHTVETDARFLEVDITLVACFILSINQISAYLREFHIQITPEFV